MTRDADDTRQETPPDSSLADGAREVRLGADGAVAEAPGTAALALGGGRLIVALGYRSLFLTGAGLVLAGTVFFWAYFGRGAGSRRLSRRPIP